MLTLTLNLFSVDLQNQWFVSAQERPLKMLVDLNTSPVSNICLRFLFCQRGSERNSNQEKNWIRFKRKYDLIWNRGFVFLIITLLRNIISSGLMQQWRHIILDPLVPSSYSLVLRLQLCRHKISLYSPWRHLWTAP